MRPVLVVTRIDDSTADLVIRELHDRGVPVVRLDPGSDFPDRAGLNARLDDRGLTGLIETRSRTLDLSRVRSVYWRRPSLYARPTEEGDQSARFAVEQRRYGLGGVLATLPGALYVNHPWRNRDAEYKPMQLATAVQAGLSVPSTLITDSPTAASAFAATHDPVVYKPLRHVSYQAEDGTGRVVWVREIEPGAIDERVQVCPHLFQARVPKIADIRVAAVGDQVFPVRIDIDGDHLDWREDYRKLTYTPITALPSTRSAIRAYMQAFGLSFAAFDFALIDDGSWVFIEANPNGQWAFVDPATNGVITSALADLLQQGSNP